MANWQVRIQEGFPFFQKTSMVCIGENRCSPGAGSAWSRGTIDIHIAIRLLVGSVFAVLAAVFVGLSTVLYSEFMNSEWFALAVFDSQLFLFFPIFGVLALIVFYLPACVLFDIYWRHVAGGRWLLLIALATLVAMAPLIAQLLTGSSKALWDLTPEVLLNDKGEQCHLPSPSSGAVRLPVPSKPGTCTRLPFLQALKNMRAISREQFSMSVFARNCRPNKYVALPASQKEKHYCFVNNQMQSAKECCAAQQAFTNALERAHAQSDGGSMTRQWYRRLLPFHVFFLLFIFGLGISLARRGKWLDQPEYSAVRSAVERRVIAGAVSMMFWPLLNHSFLQSANILYGNDTNSTFRMIAPMFTVLFGIWALMFLFFFFRSFPEAVKRAGQIAGVIGSAIAFFRFDEIVDALSRMAGSGADQFSVGIVLLAMLILLGVISASKHLLTPASGPDNNPER